MRGMGMNRRHVLSLLVAGAATVAVRGARAQEQPPAPPQEQPQPQPQPEIVYTPYTDPLNRFALAVPEGWVPLRPTVAEIIGAWGASDEPGAVFTVIRVPLPPDTSGETFAGTYLATLRGLSGYVEVAYRVVTVAEQEAPLLDYTLPDANGNAHRPVRVQQVFLVSAAEGTVLSFRCPAATVARYAVPVGTMVGSFTL